MSMRPATCQVCAYYAVGIVSSEPCICGPNVECQKEPPCAVAMNASAAPSPAWLTEHTAVVEAVLAEHEPFGGGAFCTCTPEHDDGSRDPLAIYHDAHVAAAITAALAAEAEKGGASDE